MRVHSLQITNLKSYTQAKIEFSDGINLLIGPNNAGKSTIIKSLMNLQYSSAFEKRDIRSQEISAKTVINICDISEDDMYSFYNPRAPKKLTYAPNITISWHLGLTPAGTIVEEHLSATDSRYFEDPSAHINRKTEGNDQDSPFNTFIRFSNSEDESIFIFPFLSKRKTDYYDSNVNQEQSFKIQEGMRNLAARIQRIENPSHPRHNEFIDLCDDILGFRIGVIPIDHQNISGQEPGMYVTNTSMIPIKSMGEGVANIVGFIVTLLTEDNKLILVEELENDIHPTALKKLLRLIQQKSKNNQLVISTHSHIVLKFLGAICQTKIFYIESVNNFKNQRIPTSHINEVENRPESRVEILEKLGYDFHDFELYESYLILEESSAERVIRDFLIPNIVPELYNRLRTIAARGVDDLEIRVVDFNRLFVFLHTNPVYHGKAWVVADGDKPGVNCISKLKKEFKSWPKNHFLNFSKSNFEEFYPKRFKKEVDAALSLTGKAKRTAKVELLNQVMLWSLKNREEAVKEFKSSASEVIKVLKVILAKLNENKSK
jgi:predicted ATPase